MQALAVNLTLLVDGISYAMVLFMISVGLTVTLGVMRVANLAHCGFAMLGAYTALSLMREWNLSLLGALPLATAAMVALGIILERTVYRWVYSTSQLGQILMTIGLVFVMIATANLFFGSSTHVLAVPAWLAGTLEVQGVSLSAYRMFLVLVSLAIALGLWAVLDYTQFGARLRASVDNPRMARCVGIDVPRMFSWTFAAGCGLAAAGGILGGQLLPLDPWYALKYLVPVLMVVAVGGLGSLKGSLYSALLLGLADTFGRYYFPAAGAFVIYIVVMAVLLWRREGLFGRR